ncbi:MAG: ACT domain-containing protein [Pseudomonadota bacterium]
MMVPRRPRTPPRVQGRGIRRNQAVSFCTTCWPVPGDRIMGVSRKDGMVVHAVFCPMLEDFENELQHWQDLTWSEDASKTAVNLVRIELTLANEPGALGQVCTLVGEQNANIDNLAMITRKPDFFRIHLDLEVRDTKHLGGILTALKAQSYVNHVERAVSAPTRPIPEEQRSLPLGRAALTGH